MIESHKTFFVLVKSIYDYMPVGFTTHVKQAKFYRYIQDERKRLKFPYTSLKEVEPKQMKAFVNEFMSFVYSHVLSFYFDVDKVEEIKKELENKYKKLFNG